MALPQVVGRRRRAEHAEYGDRQALQPVERQGQEGGGLHPPELRQLARLGLQDHPGDGRDSQELGEGLEELHEPVEPEQAARIAAAAPGLDVLYEPELLPRPRQQVRPPRRDCAGYS